MDWLTNTKLPLGQWIERFVDYLNEHAAWFFDLISDALVFLIEGLIALLQWCPPLLAVGLIAALGYWLHRSWVLAAGIALSLSLIINLGYWEETTETLALVVFATLACLIVGVPTGIAAAHRPGFIRRSARCWT